MVPGWGTGMAKVTFKVAGGWDVRSYIDGISAITFLESRVCVCDTLAWKVGITHSGGDVEREQMRGIEDVVLGQTRFYR